MFTKEPPSDKHSEADIATSAKHHGSRSRSSTAQGKATTKTETAVIQLKDKADVDTGQAATGSAPNHCAWRQSKTANGTRREAICRRDPAF